MKAFFHVALLMDDAPARNATELSARNASAPEPRGAVDLPRGPAQ